MRHTVDLLVDELPEALRRAADLFRTGELGLERMSLTPGRPHRVTAVFRSDSAGERFARAVGGTPMRSRTPHPERVPYQWQADGAGDFGVE